MGSVLLSRMDTPNCSLKLFQAGNKPRFKTVCFSRMFWKDRRTKLICLHVGFVLTTLSSISKMAINSYLKSLYSNKFCVDQYNKFDKEQLKMNCSLTKDINLSNLFLSYFSSWNFFFIQISSKSVSRTLLNECHCLFIQVYLKTEELEEESVTSFDRTRCTKFQVDD